MSKGKFFNQIGVADMERVHSAVVGWMLSDECEAFDIVARSKMLNELFGVDTEKCYSEIKTRLEWHDIDIMFITKYKNQEEYWVLENKIKTSQHSDQLNKYEVELKEKSTTHYVFLTLIGETALSKSGQWLNVTYQKLVELLQKNLQVKLANTDSVILQEYYYAVKQLTDAATCFINSPQSFPTVFTNGSKSKEEKENCALADEDETSKFIRQNNLETIFQKMYFAQILCDVLKQIDFPNPIWHVGETRGNADFALHFGKRKEKTFHFDISFQSGTFKFAVSKDYWIDKSKKNINDVKDWESCFKSLQDIKDFADYATFNGPRSRARISLSKNIKNGNNEWYKMSREEFTKLVKGEFEKAIKMKQWVIEEKSKNNINV